MIINSGEGNVITVEGTKIKTVGGVTYELSEAVAPDSSVVHNTGDETIAGEKTFTENVVVGDIIIDAESNEIAAASETTDFTINAGDVDLILKGNSHVKLDNGNITPIANEDVASKKYVDDNKPTQLSQLSGDATHRLVTDTEKSTWNGKANNTAVVHNTGDETIAGEKTFTDDIIIGNVSVADNLLPKTASSVPDVLVQGTIYDLGTQANLSLVLPSEGQLGQFIEVDFLSGATPTTLSISSSAGLSDIDFTPEANTIYSLYFDWGALYYDSTEDEYIYGWRFSYAEYTHTAV